MEKFKKVDIHHYNKIKQIGKGMFGKVYLVQNKKTNEYLAAKVIDIDLEELILNGTVSDSIALDIYREIEIISNLNHPTLIKFYGYSFLDFEDKKAVTLFLNYIENGALKNFCYEKSRIPNEKYDSTTRQIILVGIAYGMKLFHQEGGIHRDLKPENILVDKDLHPVITDFGCAKIMNSKVLYQTEGKGSPYYMAPEMNNNDNNYDNKVDVYSFAILMFEIVTESFCFPNNDLCTFQFIKQVQENYLRPTFPPEKPVKPSMKRLIELCWSNDPYSRPSFEEIFNCLAYNDDSRIEFDRSGGLIKEDNDDKKYYLDGVDVGKLLEYVSLITKDEQKNDEEEEEEELLSELSENYSDDEKSSQKDSNDDDEEESEDQTNNAKKGKQKAADLSKQKKKQVNSSSQKVKDDENVKKKSKTPIQDSNKPSKEKTKPSKNLTKNDEKPSSKQNSKKGQNLTKPKKPVKKKSDSDDNNYKLSDFSQAEIDAFDDDDDEQIWTPKNKGQKSDTYFRNTYIKNKGNHTNYNNQAKSSENFKPKSGKTKIYNNQPNSHLANTNGPYHTSKRGGIYHKSRGQSYHHTNTNTNGGGGGGHITTNNRSSSNYRPSSRSGHGGRSSSTSSSSLAKRKAASKSTFNIHSARPKKPISQPINQTSEIKVQQTQKTNTTNCQIQ